MPGATPAFVVACIAMHRENASPFRVAGTHPARRALSRYMEEDHHVAKAGNRCRRHWCHLSGNHCACRGALARRTGARIRACRGRTGAWCSGCDVTLLLRTGLLSGHLLRARTIRLLRRPGVLRTAVPSVASLAPLSLLVSAPRNAINEGPDIAS